MNTAVVKRIGYQLHAFQMDAFQMNLLETPLVLVFVMRCGVRMSLHLVCQMFHKIHKIEDYPMEVFLRTLRTLHLIDHWNV